MTQDYLAISILLLTILYVFWFFIKKIIKPKNNLSGCSSCPSAVNCSLKELKKNMDKKKNGCEEPERLD